MASKANIHAVPPHQVDKHATKKSCKTSSEFRLPLATHQQQTEPRLDDCIRGNAGLAACTQNAACRENGEQLGIESKEVGGLS